RRNLISISLLDKCGYYFNFRGGKVDLLFDSKLIGSCVLSDNLYRLCLDDNVYGTCDEINMVSKRPLSKEKSFTLWHKRLGHISKEKVEKLIKDSILPSLDFGDFDVCVDCIRGKMTKTKKKGATRSLGLLEIIHIDISGPYSPTICKNKYFITFIDDFF